MSWHNSMSHQIELAKWLNKYGQLETPGDVIRFFEQTWKWTAEWNAYQVLRPDTLLLVLDKAAYKRKAIIALKENNPALFDVLANEIEGLNMEEIEC